MSEPPSASQCRLPGLNRPRSAGGSWQYKLRLHYIYVKAGNTELARTTAYVQRESGRPRQQDTGPTHPQLHSVRGPATAEHTHTVATFDKWTYQISRRSHRHSHSTGVLCMAAGYNYNGRAMGAPSKVHSRRCPAWPLDRIWEAVLEY